MNFFLRCESAGARSHLSGALCVTILLELFKILKGEYRIVLVKRTLKMSNPRKFSEKIALHTQKQAEETAAFEKIMQEVMDATVSKVR